MTQFLVEEAAAEALDLYEAALRSQAAEAPSESSPREHHKKMMEAASGV